MNRQGEPIEPREPTEPLERIVERLRDGVGREESFRTLFDRFYWPLFRFFERRGFTTEECQDLIQETFLRVHRSIGAFRGEAPWEHWLFRIAANTAAKSLRHRAATKRSGRAVPLDGADAGDSAATAAAGSPRGADAPAPLRRLLGMELTELLGRAIAGFPAQMRRCVRLRVFHDLDYDEIADVLQISPSTVKVQLFKARKRLKMDLGEALAEFDL